LAPLLSSPLLTCVRRHASRAAAVGQAATRRASAASADDEVVDSVGITRDWAYPTETTYTGNFDMADEIWSEIRFEALKELRHSSSTFHRFGMNLYLERAVIEHTTLTDAISSVLGNKLAKNEWNDFVDYNGMVHEAFQRNPEQIRYLAQDLKRYREVDPACERLLDVFMCYKGFQAIALSRVAHHYWNEPNGTGVTIARLLQSEASDIFGVDIHPAASIGGGAVLDHGTGVVIGETAALGENVYLMHDVTLGATGTSGEHDRHPKVESNVFLAAKCSVLGNITVGRGATVAAHALVNKPVPPYHTAVGVPAVMRGPRQSRQEQRRQQDEFPKGST